MKNIDLLVSNLSNNEQVTDELLRSCGVDYPIAGLSDISDK